MSLREITAGRAYVEIALRKAAFVKGLRSAQERLQNFGRGMAVFGTGVMAMGTSVLTPLLSLLPAFASAGNALDKMSNRTGASVQFLSEMGYAAEQAGQDIGLIEESLIGAQKFVSDANRELSNATDGLDALGLTLKDFEGLGAEEQLDLITDSLAGIEDVTKRNQAAMFAFGKQTGPAVASITDGLRAARAEARELGLSPSNESVRRAAELTDAINRVRRVVKATTNAIAAAIAPAVTRVLGVVQGIAVGVQRWVKQNASLFATIAKIGAGLVIAGAAIVAFGGGLYVAGAAIGVFISLMSAAAVAVGFLLSPVGLIISGLAGLTTWFLTSTNAGRSFASQLGKLFIGVGTTVRETFGGIADAITNGKLELAGRIAVTGLRLVFMQGIDALANGVGGRFGDLIGTIGTKLVGGDFKGAWDSVIKQMAALWDSFTAGIVGAFTGAANAVVGVWQKAVTSISSAMLKFAATETGGALMEPLLGRNVHEDIRNQSDGHSNLISTIDEEMTRLGDQRIEAFKAGDHKRHRELRARIKELDERVQGLLKSGPGDPLGDMLNSSAEQIQADADAMRGTLDGWNEQANENAAESRRIADDDTAGGARAASDEVERLVAELARLRAEARQQDEANKARAGERQKNAAAGFDGGKLKTSTLAVFSSSAAFAMQQGGFAAQNPVVDAVGKVEMKLDKEAKERAIANAEMILEMKALRAENVFA